MASSIRKAKNIKDLSCSLDSISDGDIADAVDRGLQSTIKDLEILGMSDVICLKFKRINNFVEDRDITEEDSEEESEALADENNITDEVLPEACSCINHTDISKRLRDSNTIQDMLWKLSQLEICHLKEIRPHYYFILKNVLL